MADLLNDLDIDLLANYDMELYGALQARGLSEIQEAENLLFKQVWYNRHQNLRINIERGREREEHAATIDMLEKLAMVLEVDPIEFFRQ